MGHDTVNDKRNQRCLKNSRKLTVTFLKFLLLYKQYHEHLYFSG
jgi:hypothetical protein